MRIQLFVALFFLLSLQSAFAGDRIALPIGNSRYQNATPLRNPENDVILVGNSLRQAGFKTIIKTNLTLQQTNIAISEFIAAARRLKNPVLMIYYAGHGVQLNGQNYLLPIDVKIGDARTVIQTSVSVSTLLDRLPKRRSALEIIILDACRNDPFTQKTRGLSQGLKQIREQPGRLIAFSTAPGTTAVDGDSGTSPYASAVAEAVLIPGIEVRFAFD